MNECHRPGAVVLAAICAALVACPVLGDTSPSSPHPSLTGLTGIIRVPTADVAPHSMGHVAWTSAMDPADTSIGAQSTRTFGFCPLSKAELSLSLGRYLLSSQEIGWDLIIHGKAQVATQEGWRPAVAIGAAD
ncbi:MAG: hypothetical protein FJX72_15605, partial [Armatimonadetes bacterium]|nr:hypothetical protein [Armatimonadota bacterium]